MQTTETKHVISLCNILGNTAKFAVQQSPYTVPEGLSEAITHLNSRLRGLVIKEALPDFWCGDFTRQELNEILKTHLLSCPQVQKWNERKNGNPSPFQFVSRYDGKRDPDNDFIDLDALIGNIVRCCIKDSID